MNLVIYEDFLEFSTPALCFDAIWQRGMNFFFLPNFQAASAIALRLTVEKKKKWELFVQE